MILKQENDLMTSIHLVMLTPQHLTFTWHSFHQGVTKFCDSELHKFGSFCPGSPGDIDKLTFYAKMA